MNFLEALRAATEPGAARVMERENSIVCAVPYGDGTIGVDVLYSDGSLKQDGGLYAFKVEDYLADDWTVKEVTK